MKPFKIVSAAMLMDDGLVVPGVRHFSPDMRAVLRRMYGSGIKVFGVWIRKPYHLRVCQQGFVDSSGRFLNRREARKVALECGQVDILESSSFLYSEDLY